MHPFRTRAPEAFTRIQADLVARFEALEPGARFTGRPWTREGLGSGTATTLRGRVFEKAGVNFSSVGGAAYPLPEGELAGQPYFATGVSVVCHMHNPHVPAAHLNVRYLEVGEKAWFGGGADLTPCFPDPADTQTFHDALRGACGEDYPRFKDWCDRYFYIEHRKSPRGVGGVFFDQLPADERGFALVQALGAAFGAAYGAIVARRKDHPFTEEEREQLLYFRGRYVEFNLVYDKGTLFGLKSGGDPDAIFMSLPPLVRW